MRWTLGLGLSHMQSPVKTGQAQGSLLSTPCPSQDEEWALVINTWFGQPGGEGVAVRFYRSEKQCSG